LYNTLRISILFKVADQRLNSRLDKMSQIKTYKKFKWAMDYTPK
jgi:hypothetical protein